MRLELKKAFDYYFGRPLLALFQLFAWILARIIRRDHAVEPIRTIVIVKFQGIGSLIIAKPALNELRRRLPNTRIIFWGTPALKALAEQMPEFDEVLVLNDRSLATACRSAISNLVRLWREPLDWALDLEVYSRLSSVLVTLSAARNRTGFAIEQIRSRRVHTHLVFFNRYRHVGEAYARMVGQLLPSGDTVDLDDYGTWRFSLDPLASVRAPYFVINIHAGDLALERRWPRESFSALIDELLRLRPDITIYLIGHGDSEIAYSQTIAPRTRLQNLSGKLSLTETIRLVANADLVVTNDTAPLHFALSTKVKLVGIFGPTRAETYVRPAPGRVATAQLPLYCSPCVHHWEPAPCDGDNQCMKQLTVSRVLELCSDLLGLRMPARSDPPAVQSNYYPGQVYKRVRLTHDHSGVEIPQ